MEKKYSKNPEKSFINLRHLPPIDPRIITTHSFQVKHSDAPVSKVIKANPLEGINLAEDNKAAATPNSAYATQPHILRAQATPFASRRGCKRSNKTKENRASPTDSTLEGTDRSRVSIQEVLQSRDRQYPVCTRYVLQKIGRALYSSAAKKKDQAT